MKILSVSIILILTVSFIEVPFMANKTNPRTCCGREICLCRHAPGAECSFRSKHGFHHAQSDTEALNLFTGFTKAPCHSNTPKASLPQHSKEFIVSMGQSHLFMPVFSALFQHTSNSRDLLFDHRLKRPPRTFSLL